MNDCAGRTIILKYASALLIASAVVPTAAWAEETAGALQVAANKVKTKRVQVPEEPAEKPSQTDENISADNEDEEDDQSFEIPIDALPNIENNHKQADDTAEDEDEITSDPKPRFGNGPPPPVQRDLSKLPEPVQRMRELVLAAAKKGDIESLRSLIGLGDNATSLAIGGLDGDPIAFLKDASGDEDGYEILAILIEVLEAGYVHLDAGKDDEVYVWPYFFAWPFEKLTPEMNIEMYRILTAGDVEDSKGSGRYIFYRVGIKPDGNWSFFVAGD